MNELTRLQPIYAEMIKNTNEETVRRVRDELKKTNPVNLQQLQDYVLLPLISKIDSDTLTNNEIKVQLIVTLNDLLDVTSICKLIPLKIIIVVLLKQVFESSNLKRNLSEELKLAVVECFAVTFRKTTTDVKSEFYVPESRALIGQIVYFCVNLIEKEVYRKLRLSSINCLLSTLYIDDDADFSDMVLRDQISNEAYVMTPKVLAVLKSIALGDAKLGHSLISLSVKALGKFLCLIFEDYNKYWTKHDVTLEDFKALINKNKNNEDSIQLDSNILGKNNTTSPKTNEWLNAAMLKITPTIESIKILIGNKNSKIRLELAKMSISVLEKCLSFLQPCINHLVEILLALSQDEDQTISELCDRAIRTTLQELSYHEVVESIFITHIVRLPRIISVGDEEEQIAAMLLLKGLVQSLRLANLKIIFAVKDTLERFTTVLLSAVELKRDMSLLLEEYSLRNVAEIEGNVFATSTWKQFKNLRTPTIINHFQSICELIGASNGSDIVVSYLLELLPENVNICNEIIVLLQFLLSSNGHKTSICNCLEDFLLDIHWHLAIQANKTTKLEMKEFGDSQWYEDRTEGLYESAISIRYTDVRWNGTDGLENAYDEIAIADAMFNVLHTCLIVETVGHFAFVLQKDFQPFLFKSLHKILEKSGSSNHAIHLAGSFALNKLKMGLGYESISEMIYENSDYITYFVNLSLKKVNQSQIALDILSVVLKYSSLNSIPHLENIITTVLNESTRNEQNSNMSSFLKVFKMILFRIDEWNVSTESNLNESLPDIEDSEIELRRNWLNILNEDEFHGQRSTSTFDEATFREEQEQKLNNEDEPENEADTPIAEVLQPYMDVTIQIMKRCIKHISTKSQMDKCIVLESISCGLNILRSKENQLLPIVHLIWKPFVERFKENDPIVLRRCFQLLIKLGEVSKDFIYQRTAKDVLPFLLSFLTSSGKNSINVKDVTYEHTQQYKLQMELLQNVHTLLTVIEITEKDVNSVIDAILPYCKENQHRTLQDTCVEFLLQLARYDTTAVYVKLRHHQNDDCYKGNVIKILKKL